MGIRGEIVTEAEKMVEKSAVSMMKHAHDGRNMVSASRALEGKALSEGVYGGRRAMDNMAEDAGMKGPAGRLKASNAAAVGKKEMTQGMNSPLGGNMRAAVDKKDATKTAMVTRTDDNMIHRMETLRNEKSGLVQYNETGYGNPSLSRSPEANFSLNAPETSMTRSVPVQHTFDSRPNPTEASAILAQRTSNY